MQCSAVVNWVLSCIGLLVFKKVISRNRMLGIIGYGNVGKLLSKILENLNIKHKIYDPYLDLGNINDFKRIVRLYHSCILFQNR
ncbi:MAG: hypothetical protein Ct9H90mP6_02360 [Gammaproteobacteria bacterium]|nr:MAG: hypothetical protein Ct9H90mP6_02360 [Gammaproteobacteria bacterium]